MESEEIPCQNSKGVAISNPFIDCAVMRPDFLSLFEHLSCTGHVVGLDDYTCGAILREGIHVLDEQSCLCEPFHVVGERARHIRHVDEQHVGDVGCKRVGAEHLESMVGVVHDKAHDAEFGILGYGEGLHVDSGCPQQGCHLGKAPQLVLEEDRDLFDDHGMKELCEGSFVKYMFGFAHGALDASGLHDVDVWLDAQHADEVVGEP